MTKELFEVLEALCSMWIQYCPPPTGHMCMSAGEATEEVLDKYNLLINKDKFPYGGEVDWERLNELEKESEKEYANQDKWINCADKLPEDYQRVLGYVEEINDLGKSHFAWNVSYSKYHGFLDNLKPCQVTHWQPLPEPPKNI